jgi:hypothetical protein
MKVTAEELSKLNRDVADACLAHPFVRGIGSGTFRASVAGRSSVIQRLRMHDGEGVLSDGILHDEWTESAPWELTCEAHGEAR